MHGAFDLVILGSRGGTSGQNLFIVTSFQRAGPSRDECRRREHDCAVFNPVESGRLNLVRRFLVFEDLAKRFIRLVLKKLSVSGKYTAQVVKAGNDKDTDDSTQQHPADCRCANRAVSDCPGTRGSDQWNQPGDEGEGGHENRPEAQFSSFDGCILETHAFVAALHREFND